MRRRKHLRRVDENIVSRYFNAGNIGRMHQIGKLDVEATEQSLHGNLQRTDLCHMELHAAIRRARELSRDLNRNRKDLMCRPADLQLIAVGNDRDICERSVRRTHVEVVSKIANIRPDDSLSYPQDKRIRVVERWCDLRMRAQHLSGNPSNVNTKV